MTTLIELNFTGFAAGFCWQNPTQYGQALVDAIQATFNSDIGNSFFNMGTTTPTAPNRIYPWLNTTNGRWYVYSATYGGWISPYPIPAGPNGVRWEWEDSLANLATFDGGAAGPITITAGAFWVEDTNYQGRSSMGTVAALSTGLPFAYGTNAGDLTITQQANQVGSHTHNFSMGAFTSSGGGQNPPLDSNNDRTPTNPWTTDVNQSTVQPMSILHSVRSNYKIKRSARAYYFI